MDEKINKVISELATHTDIQQFSQEWLRNELRTLVNQVRIEEQSLTKYNFEIGYERGWTEAIQEHRAKFDMRTAIIARDKAITRFNKEIEESITNDTN